MSLLDIRAKVAGLNAARKAAAELRQLCSGCHTSFLREEGALFAKEAVDVIGYIERKAAATIVNPDSSHLLVEVISMAALKAEHALRVLAGRIAAAERQAKHKNLLYVLGRQLYNPYKQMFKDARECLNKVVEMTEFYVKGAVQQQQLQAKGIPLADVFQNDAGTSTEHQRHPHVLPGPPLEVAAAACHAEPLEPDSALVQEGEPEALEPSTDGIHPHHVICNSELVLKEVIGSGAEGKVYRGTWTNIDIAAKEFLPSFDDDDGDDAYYTQSKSAMQKARECLRNEAALLMCFNHPNLVRFCGVCLDPPLVVMEYYSHGNLFNMVEKARRQWAKCFHGDQATQRLRAGQATKYMDYFTWDRRLELLHDVASGMIYLHKRHYVHGDLRTPNLFIGMDGRVKIGDFGFTGRVSANTSRAVRRITHPRWVAPELMTDYCQSTASDVYSFGIVMYELLTWQLPFHDRNKEQVVFAVLAGQRPEIPAEGQLPPGTSSSTFLSRYIELMQQCWDEQPECRPAFDQIAARLKAMIRWRKVLQRNKILTRVAGKLRAAAAVTASAPAEMLAGSVAPGSSTADQLANKATSSATAEAFRRYSATGCQPEGVQDATYPTSTYSDRAFTEDAAPVAVPMFASSGASTPDISAASTPPPSFEASLACAAAVCKPSGQEPAGTDDDAAEPGVQCTSPMAPAHFEAPVGHSDQIMHIDESELDLHTLACCNSFCKVYRGAWHGADVTVVEYLPQLVQQPTTESATGTHGLPGGDPSVAAALRLQVLTAAETAAIRTHPHTLRLFGCCMDPPMLVTEYHTTGGVRHLLTRAHQELASSSSSHSGQLLRAARKLHDYLSWKRRLQMLQETVSALTFLHHHGCELGELDCSRMLLGPDGKIRLATAELTGWAGQGSPTAATRWTSSEKLQGAGCGAASDIYSLGMVMYEMLTWQIPFHELSDATEVKNLVLQGGRPTIPPAAQLPPGTAKAAGLQQYIDLMQLCWHQDPNKRPALVDIAHQLKIIAAGGGVMTSTGRNLLQLADISQAGLQQRQYEWALLPQAADLPVQGDDDFSPPGTPPPSCGLSAGFNSQYMRSLMARIPEHASEAQQQPDNTSPLGRAWTAAKSAAPSKAAGTSADWQLLKPLARHRDTTDAHADKQPQQQPQHLQQRSLEQHQQQPLRPPAMAVRSEVDPRAQAAASKLYAPATGAQQPVNAATVTAGVGEGRDTPTTAAAAAACVQAEWLRSDSPLPAAAATTTHPAGPHATAWHQTEQPSVAAAADVGPRCQALQHSLMVHVEPVLPPQPQGRPSVMQLSSSAGCSTPHTMQLASHGAQDLSVAEGVQSTLEAVDTMAEPSTASHGQAAVEADLIPASVVVLSPAPTVAAAVTATPAAAACSAEQTLVDPAVVLDGRSCLQEALVSLQQLQLELSSRLLRLLVMYTAYRTASTLMGVQQEVRPLLSGDSTAEGQQRQQQQCLQERVVLQLQTLLLLLQSIQHQQQRGQLTELLSQFAVVHLSIGTWRYHIAADTAAASSVTSQFHSSDSCSNGGVSQEPLFVVYASVGFVTLCWLLLPVTAAMMATIVSCSYTAWHWLSRVQCRPQRLSTLQEPQQQHQPAVSETASEGVSYPRSLQVYSSLSGMPGTLLVAPQPDSCRSTVGYASWPVQWQAPEALEALSRQQQQQQQQLLLYTLPVHRYRASYKPHSAGQHTTTVAATRQRRDDDITVRDQDQHLSVQQRFTSDSTEVRHQLLDVRCHPVLSSQVLSAQHPAAPFLQCLDQLMQQHQEGAADIAGQVETPPSSPTAPGHAWVQVLWLCLDPPMLLEAIPACSLSLAAWLLQQQQQQLRGTYNTNSSQQRPWQPPFPAAAWPQVLTWLQQVAAALAELHRVGIVHGGLHAGAIYLADAGDSRDRRSADSSSDTASSKVAVLSLVSPWQHAVTPGCVVDPAFAPPEVQLGSQPPTSNPAVDVYGFGMVMWQLATGWVPQQLQQSDTALSQAASGSLGVYDELSWCAEMMQHHGTTFPGVVAMPHPQYNAADEDDNNEGVAAEALQPSDHAAPAEDLADPGSSTEGTTPDSSIPSSWYCRHGWLPPVAAAWLPDGYKQLMLKCCSLSVGQRPSITVVCQCIANVLREHTCRI